MSELTRAQRIDLGLEILCATRRGKQHSYREIAAFAGCTWQNIYYKEKLALEKMRRAAKQKGLIA